ncbi:hypothetical protein AKJ16_DCAP00996 [Drosera capensis]
MSHTFKKRTGSSPLDFASERVWISRTLVTNATRPFLEQASHVPPPSSSLPPSISPPSHHPTGAVGLQANEMVNKDHYQHIHAKIE